MSEYVLYRAASVSLSPRVTVYVEQKWVFTVIADTT